MSIHINAKDGEIAERVLLPGDPLRAKYLADTFFENPKQYNTVRGMLGYTGTYKGRRISVQGSGMGMPSLAIYVNELIDSYGVKELIRVGSCGALQPDIKLRDVLLAQGASTESSMNKIRFNGLDYAPLADWDLLLSAYNKAQGLKIPVKVGNILSNDSFYQADKEWWKNWAEYGVLAVEMETSALYTLAAKAGVKALAILTVSDSLVTWEETSSEEREKTFKEMMQIALEC
jgi:purine-nucleoside phosphorylase